MQSKGKDLLSAVLFTSKEHFLGVIKKINDDRRISALDARYAVGMHFESIRTDSKNCPTYREIADFLGSSESSIRTMHKFAVSYSLEQLEILKKGNGKFILAWRDVANNLSLKAQDLLTVYQGAETPEDFRNAVTEAKGSNSKGKPSPSYKDLQKRVQELERENKKLREDLEKARQEIQRLKQGDQDVQPSSAPVDPVESPAASAADNQAESCPGFPPFEDGSLAKEAESIFDRDIPNEELEYSPEEMQGGQAFDFEGNLLV